MGGLVAAEPDSPSVAEEPDSPPPPDSNPPSDRDESEYEPSDSGDASESESQADSVPGAGAGEVVNEGGADSEERKESDVAVAAEQSEDSATVAVADSVTESDPPEEPNKGGRPSLPIWDLGEPIGAVSDHSVGAAMKLLFHGASSTRMNVTQTKLLFQSAKGLCENGQNKIPHYYHAKKIVQAHNPLTINKYAVCPVNDCELVKLSENDAETKKNPRLDKCSKCAAPLRDAKGRINKVSDTDRSSESELSDSEQLTHLCAVCVFVLSAQPDLSVHPAEAATHYDPGRSRALSAFGPSAAFGAGPATGRRGTESASQPRLA